jgi:hypothetical protein
MSNPQEKHTTRKGSLEVILGASAILIGLIVAGGYFLDLPALYRRYIAELQRRKLAPPITTTFNPVSRFATWAKTYGGGDFDGADSIQQTTDGGYIVAGKTGSFGAGDGDIWVLKLNASGDVVWQKTYGGGGWDEAFSIQQTTDGGYIVAGTTGSFGAGGDDGWVLKLNASGDVVWQKTYGGKEWDEASSIQQTTDGGYIVAGTTGSFGAGGYDFWVLKLNASGDVVWQKTYGGGDHDEATSIQQTSDGGYIVAGWTKSFGAGGSDFWVLKLDASGDVANCTPAGLVRVTNAIPASPSITASSSGVTPATPSPTVTNTNIMAQDSAATSATQCTG